MAAWAGGRWGVSGMRHEKDLAWKSWEAVALAYDLVYFFFTKKQLFLFPKHEPPSHLPPHITTLDHPCAPAPSILYPASNIDWRFKLSWTNKFVLLLFSHSVMANSLEPHGLQHTRLPCPSPSPRACSNSCPLSW